MIISGMVKLQNRISFYVAISTAETNNDNDNKNMMNKGEISREEKIAIIEQYNGIKKNKLHHQITLGFKYLRIIGLKDLTIKRSSDRKKLEE